VFRLKLIKYLIQVSSPLPKAAKKILKITTLIHMKMMVLLFLYLIYIFKVRTGLLIEDLPSVFNPNNC